MMTLPGLMLFYGKQSRSLTLSAAQCGMELAS